MKKIGIIGGLGPEATVDYYNGIINSFKKKGSDLNYPEILIYSVNMSEFLGLMNSKEYEKVVTLLVQKIDSLKKAGADFVAMTANTPHLLFNEIEKRSELPMISIVEATCRYAKKSGLKNPALLGTGFTMREKFFQDVFNREGLTVEVPAIDDRDWIHNKLFTEIELGIFKDETRNGLERIIGKMKNENAVDSVILGCTELPLILKEKFYSGIPALNTTQIHVNEIVNYCMNDV
jgi:aspartate racemase